jgi:hypothetical protein
MLKVIKKGIVVIQVGEQASAPIICPEMILPNAFTSPPTDGDMVLTSVLNSDDGSPVCSIMHDQNDQRFYIYADFYEQTPRECPCVIQYLVVREVPDMELTLRVKD